MEVAPEESNLDTFHEECGVFGVFGHPEAANLAYLGMYALQHRGQESAGIVSSNGKSLISHRGMGLVADIFNSDVINRLEGTAAIGHNRYSTAGSTDAQELPAAGRSTTRAADWRSRTTAISSTSQELRERAGSRRLASSSPPRTAKSSSI